MSKQEKKLISKIKDLLGNSIDFPADCTLQEIIDIVMNSFCETQWLYYVEDYFTIEEIMLMEIFETKEEAIEDKRKAIKI